jgi:uncharacterized protein
MIRRLFTWHARLVVRRPWGMGLVLGLISVGALMLLPRFRIDPDIAGFLPREGQAQRLLSEVLLDGDSARQLLVVLRGGQLEQRLPGIVADLSASPFLEGVDAGRGELAQGSDSGLGALPTQTLDALEERLTPAGRRAAIAESRALLAEDPLVGRTLVVNDPLGLRWILEDARRRLSPPGLSAHSEYLVWPEQELALLRVTGTRSPFDVEFSRALLGDLEQRLAGFDWEALGGYDVARRDSARIRGDMTSSLLWSIPLLVLFLAVSTRSLRLPHLYLVPVLVAVLWALGYGGAWLGPLTPLAVSGAAILMGLGVDFALHYLDRYRHERPGADHATAVERAHVGTGPALLLGLATTVIAFLSVSSGSFPGLLGFGLLLSLGLVAAWLATLCLAPLLARALPVPRRRPPVPLVVQGARRLVASRAGRPTAALVVLVGLMGWAAVLSGGLEFDADARFLRPEGARYEARVGRLEGALGHAPLGLRVLVPAERPAESVAAGVERLAAGGLFGRVVGVAPGSAGTARGERLAALRGQAAGLVEAVLGDLAEAGFQPEPFRAGLEDVAGTLAATPPAPRTVLWEGREYVSLLLYPGRTPRDRAEREVLRSAARTELGADAILVDVAGAGDELGSLLARDLARSLGLCALLVLGLLAWALREPRHVAAALAPVTCGLGLMLGALVLSGFPLHPGNLIALPLVLGLGVDDGIHMLLRWREGDGDPLATTGASIWRTSVTTILAFGSLASAASPAIASLGLLAGLGALACLVASLVVVPVLLGSAETPRAAR